MFDAQKILNDLRERAKVVVDSIDADNTVKNAKILTQRLKRRLESDDVARHRVMGGGALLTTLLATRGGRRLAAQVAKIGGVAALGAFVYKLWQDRQEGPVYEDVEGIDVGTIDVAVIDELRDESPDS